MTPDVVTHERETAFYDAWAGITRPESANSRGRWLAWNVLMWGEKS